MYFIIEEKKVNKYDTVIVGAILDQDLALVPDVFNKGISLNGVYNKGLKIVADNRWMKQGILSDKLFTKIHVNIPLLVISSRAADIFKKFSSNIEFVPLEIQNNSSKIEDYQIANIIDKIDCADYSKSDIEFESYDENYIGQGSIYTIDGLYLDQTKIPDNINIFLLGRHDDSIIIVHERLKNAIEKAGLEGFSFQTPENFCI